MMRSHLKDIPRVKGLYDDLSESVDRYTHQARSARLGLQNITDEIRDVQTSLEENKPGLARMSLQYDPAFVAEKVVLLESDLKEVGERFITGTSEMLDLKSHLSDRNAQLSLLNERIASLSSLPSSLKTFSESGIMFEGGVVTTSPLVTAV